MLTPTVLHAVKARYSPIKKDLRANLILFAASLKFFGTTCLLLYKFLFNTFGAMNATVGIGSRVEHSHLGRGVIVDAGSDFYVIWFKALDQTKKISKDFELKVMEAAEHTAEPEGLSAADIEFALEAVLSRRHDVMEMVPMAGKWNNGTLVLKPGDTSLQEKEMPIATFFHKIVMVRDRMRLIEQKINAHKGLTAEEKVDLQQYITGVYGSLTSFNVLFKESRHQFKGSGKESI